MKFGQLKVVSLEQLVPEDHSYRAFAKIFDFKIVEKVLSSIESKAHYKGFGLSRLFKCLLLQFIEDLSDRELERYLGENNASKWFCDFDLLDATPTYTVFTKLRSKIGPHKLSEIFNLFREQLRTQGYMGEVFTFVDASSLISKATLWKEKDDLRKEEVGKLNNKTVSKVAYDKQAKIGCKGKNKFWYGYKKHVSVDMQSGLINKVAITPAHVTDGAGFKHVCPSGGAVYMDKGYCGQKVSRLAKAKGVHAAAIKRNNMKEKDRDLDKYYSKIRAPFERVFSKDNKRARYIGVAKNQFSVFMQSIAFNLKRLLRLLGPEFLKTSSLVG